MAAPGTSEVEVLKSPQDKKSYRYLRLESGLAVLLVSDPEIPTAEADSQRHPGGSVVEPALGAGAAPKVCMWAGACGGPSRRPAARAGVAAS